MIEKLVKGIKYGFVSGLLALTGCAQPEVKYIDGKVSFEEFKGDTSSIPDVNAYRALLQEVFAQIDESLKHYNSSHRNQSSVNCDDCLDNAAKMEDYMIRLGLKD